MTALDVRQCALAVACELSDTLRATSGPDSRALFDPGPVTKVSDVTPSQQPPLRDM